MVNDAANGGMLVDRGQMVVKMVFHEGEVAVDGQEAGESAGLSWLNLAGHSAKPRVSPQLKALIHITSTSSSISIKIYAYLHILYLSTFNISI